MPSKGFFSGVWDNRPIPLVSSLAGKPHHPISFPSAPAVGVASASFSRGPAVAWWSTCSGTSYCSKADWCGSPQSISCSLGKSLHVSPPLRADSPHSRKIDPQNYQIHRKRLTTPPLHYVQSKVFRSHRMSAVHLLRKGLGRGLW